MLRGTTNHDGEFCLCALDFASRHLRDEVCGALAHNLPSKAMVFAISLATHPALIASPFRLSTHRSSMICLSLGLGAMSNSSMLVMFLISSTLPSATGSSGNSSSMGISNSSFTSNVVVVLTLQVVCCLWSQFHVSWCSPQRIVACWNPGLVISRKGTVSEAPGNCLR